MDSKNEQFGSRKYEDVLIKKAEIYVKVGKVRSSTLPTMKF